MDKEKEIQEMADICHKNKNNWNIHPPGACYSQAEALYKAGYGDVKQAVKEFADWIKEQIHGCVTISNDTDNDLCDDIDDHFKELYGDDTQ